VIVNNLIKPFEKPWLTVNRFSRNNSNQFIILNNFDSPERSNHPFLEIKLYHKTRIRFDNYQTSGGFIQR